MATEKKNCHYRKHTSPLPSSTSNLLLSFLSIYINLTPPPPSLAACTGHPFILSHSLPFPIIKTVFFPLRNKKRLTSASAGDSVFVVAFSTFRKATLGNGFCRPSVCRNHMGSSFSVLDPSLQIQVIDVVTGFVVLAVDCILSWLVR